MFSLCFKNSKWEWIFNIINRHLTFFSSLFLSFQGTNASALEKDIGPEQFPINEHYFGLVNVSITQRQSNPKTNTWLHTWAIYVKTWLGSKKIYTYGNFLHICLVNRAFLICVRYHAMLYCLVLFIGNLGDTTTFRQNNQLKCWTGEKAQFNLGNPLFLLFLRKGSSLFVLFC